MQWRPLARHWPLLPPLAMAAWLRLHGLFATPYFGDAAEYALVARSLAEDPRDLAYPDVEGFGPTPFVSQPPLVLYLFAAATRLVGPDLGPVAVTAASGILAVAVAYALGALLSDRWTGTAAAAFLAVLPSHVRMSREAYLEAPLALFAALAVLLFVLWARRPTPGRALACGAAVACAALAKLPGVVVLAALAFALAHHAWRRRREPGGVQQDLRHAALALAPLAFLLAAYTALLWWLRSTADLAAKVGWQAGRLAGVGTEARPWHWYFTEGTVGLPAQVGLLVLALAAAGAALVAAEAARRPTRRLPPGPAAGQTGRIALLAWPFLFLAFLVASARKEWFYAVPLQPALAVLAAWPAGLALRWHAQPRAASLRRGGPPVPPGRAAPAPRPPPIGAGRTAVAGAVAFLSCAAAWAPATAAIAGPGTYGQGLREAADWIHAQDPQAAQVGSTLGRFALHLENGQPTYHYWLNHSFVRESIASGRIRFVVIDAYGPDPAEGAWLAGLAEGREPAWAHRAAGTDAVRVYRAGP